MAESRARPFRSLRGRFLFYFLILGVLSLLLFGALFAYLAWRERGREEQAARDVLVEQAREMGRDMAMLFALGERLPGSALADTQRVTQLLRLEGKLIKAVSVIVDRGGEVVAPRPIPARTPRSFDPELLAENEVIARQGSFGILGEVYLVSVPLNIPSHPEYHNLLVAKRPQDLVTVSGAEITRYLVIAGGAALLLSIIMALYLSSYVLRPLRNLTHAAWELAHGKLERRVEASGQDEIAELSRYFNYMADRIQTSARLQKEFVANVSHEIRTPLTSIEGFSQALLEDMVESDEDRRRYLGIIAEESRRLKRVLEQLLALSRIDAGAWTLQPSPLPLGPFLRELVEKVMPKARDRGLELKLAAGDDLPTLETDRDALEQVLHNLLDNAVKFTPEGGEVILSADPLPLGGARIQVRDTGQGIPPEEQERVFDRFVRVERSRSQRHGGSGLGLSVCRDLVRLLGGSISLWSQPGRGTVFTVELPPEINR
ncbi:MAG: HAMP domain-containing histidine kinase [Actinobacteria bacterium]|nr:HAMP domain-containing histidine kinase [Actinomycetota bacterium]MDI6830867.1 HAMP domain-containing sensor histidine kinase [Actinomycetota bacterium]